MTAGGTKSDSNSNSANSPNQTSVEQSFSEAVQKLSPAADTYVPELLNQILQHARTARASDVHLVPEDDGLRMDWRVDGVLQTIAVFGRELAPRVIARLKVICGLLTYRTDAPQEGRVAREHSATEIRVTTFPTIHGEKAAIRLFPESDHLQRIEQLGLPSDISSTLAQQLNATDGVILRPHFLYSQKSDRLRVCALC